MRRVAVVALVSVIAACLLGCDGGGVGGGNYSSPKATFDTMWSAAKAGNKTAMMACFSDECRKKIAELEKLMADLPKEMKSDEKGDMAAEMMAKPKTAKAEVGAEKIDGDKATLEVTTDGKKDTLTFIKEGGNWKLHFEELAKMDIEQMKKAMEMMKNLSKGMKDMKDMTK